MKKSLLLLLSLFFLLNESFADHIKGGYFTYQYLGRGVNNTSNLRYRITLTVYMTCSAENNPGQLSSPINFSIFNAGTNQFVQDVSVSITSQYRLSKGLDEFCISGDQRKCYYYIVVYDLAAVELAPDANGYIISYQRCCRIAGIQNISNSGTVGNTFSIRIPGTSAGHSAETNSSPAFLVNDTAVVCSGSYFQYSFSASDPNPEDSLSYEFCSALAGGSQLDPAPVTASGPPYTLVQYSFPYTGTTPMGSGVSIDPRTGIISGIAPSSAGQYVIGVCVNEYRRGVLINTTRKELHVEVGDCIPIKASLDPEYITCDGFSFTFANNGDQSLITSYHWNFGDPGSGVANTSNLASPTHVFSDTGTFIVTLIVNPGDPCVDTATTLMKVYPGFFPDFTNTGICLNSPVQFHDATRTNYGVVDSWSWNFGDLTTLADTSHVRHPSWTYADTGPKVVVLIATNSKGCRNTVTKTITIIDKPPITLAFTDTLICVPDAVQLLATGTGNFNWTPLVRITNANTATPTVNPAATTTYYVELENGGCRNRDSVKVRVINFVSVVVGPDTTICRTDPVQLNAVTDGLKYQWTTIPASAISTLSNPGIINPIATPTDPVTIYRLRSSVGSCTSTDELTIRAVPYPVANAGPDTTICYNTSAQLHGSHNGNSFHWSPVSYLDNPSILNPVASPPGTTSFILTVFANQGCPKAGIDTAVVTVLPKIIPYAGRDTTVVVGQPLQFNATGGERYTWSPATSLSSTTISNPIGIYDGSFDRIRYKVEVYNAVGCFDTAFVTVKIFKTKPSVFVPSAFTPNGDGLNDKVRPIAAGIQKIHYFKIFNRWGEIVFSTSVNGHGWDGRIGGTPQSTNTYVWMVSATDYLGKPFFQKGTVTLIR